MAPVSPPDGGTDETPDGSVAAPDEVAEVTEAARAAGSAARSAATAAAGSAGDVTEDVTEDAEEVDGTGGTDGAEPAVEEEVPAPAAPHAPAHLPKLPAHRRVAAGAGPKLERRRLRLVLALVLLTGLTVALVAYGLNEVWNSTAGRYVSSGLEPGDENYVALVTPTPTLLVVSVHADPRTGEEELTGAALLALHPQNEGGAVVVLPSATVATDPDGGDTDLDEAPTLADAYRSGGAEAVREGVETTLVLAVADVVEVNAGGWESLTAPSGAVDVVTVDAAGSRWPAGDVELDPAEVGEFLWVTGEEESELVRLDRHQRFWDGWLTGVAGEGAPALPGEAGAGLGLFVQGLTSGPRTVVEVPMSAESISEESEPGEATDGAGSSGEERLVVDPEAIGGIVAAEVPFPQEPTPGARTRISLLNGTPDELLGQQAVAPLVEEGAEIAVTGNASSFAEPTTTFIYSGPEARPRAHALRNALGTGQVEERVLDEGEVGPFTDDGERIDVTVILGADAPGAIRRLETTD